MVPAGQSVAGVRELADGDSHVPYHARPGSGPADLLEVFGDLDQRRPLFDYRSRHIGVVLKDLGAEDEYHVVGGELLREPLLGEDQMSPEQRVVFRLAGKGRVQGAPHLRPHLLRECCRTVEGPRPCDPRPRVQVDQRCFSRSLRVAVGHPENGRLLKPEDVTEVVGEVA